MNQPHQADLDAVAAAVRDHFGAHLPEQHDDMLAAMPKHERRGLVASAVRRSASRRHIYADMHVETLVDGVEDWLWPDTPEKKREREQSSAAAVRERLVASVLMDPEALRMVLERAPR